MAVLGPDHTGTGEWDAARTERLRDVIAPA
jgi:hypothetical protein